MSGADSLRSRLRASTQEAHERMHGHPGFGAAAAGRLDRQAYADLLARLYGFHRAFDLSFVGAPPAMAEAIELPARARSGHIAEDLRAMGLSANLEALPLCPVRSPLSSEPQWLGALYVTEGATLGGAQISRALAASGVPGEQRHFFDAYGERRSELWRMFLARLEAHADESDAVCAAQEAANATFCAFESWMRDWRGAASR